MGDVYSCIDYRTGRQVAIKILNGELMDTDDARRRFAHEIRLLKKLTHPNLLPILDSGMTGDDVPFFVTELFCAADGESMTLKRLRDHGEKKRLSAQEIVDLFPGILAGLAYLHKCGIVHRDLKPENVFISEKAGRLFPIIGDFGLAAIGDPSRIAGEMSLSLSVQGEGARKRAMIGTYSYMSPEQVRGEDVGFSSDIYSFGLMLYRLSTGFQRVNPELPCGVNPELPAWVDRVVEKALVEEKGERWQDANEILAGVKEIPRHELAMAVPAPDAEVVEEGPIKKPKPAKSRSPYRLVNLALLLIILVLGVAIYHKTHPRGETTERRELQSHAVREEQPDIVAPNATSADSEPVSEVLPVSEEIKPEPEPEQPTPDDLVKKDPEVLFAAEADKIDAGLLQRLLNHPDPAICEKAALFFLKSNVKASAEDVDSVIAQAKGTHPQVLAALKKRCAVPAKVKTGNFRRYLRTSNGTATARAVLLDDKGAAYEAFVNYVLLDAKDPSYKDAANELALSLLKYPQIQETFSINKSVFHWFVPAVRESQQRKQLCQQLKRSEKRLARVAGVLG